jgi:hypothetical protein
MSSASNLEHTPNLYYVCSPLIHPLGKYLRTRHIIIHGRCLVKYILSDVIFAWKSISIRTNSRPSSCLLVFYSFLRRQTSAFMGRSFFACGFQKCKTGLVFLSRQFVIYTSPGSFSLEYKLGNRSQCKNSIANTHFLTTRRGIEESGKGSKQTRELCAEYILRFWQP